MVALTDNEADGVALAVRDVEAGYFAHDLVLNGVSLQAKTGKVTVVLGPNGSGKSTALRVAYGLLPPRRGRVLLGTQDITAVPTHQRVRLGVGFLPQGRTVFEELSVHENLEMGGWSLGRDRSRLPSICAALYTRYPQLASVRDKPAGSLSGGQQRILEIARMLVTDPRVVLMDEPSAGLAPIVAEQVYHEIAAFRHEGRTVLLVDQDVRAAVAVADYVYTLEFGQNRLEGGRDAFEGKLGAVIRDWLRV